MREYLAQLIVNDCENGDCLEKVRAVFEDKEEDFEDCEDFAESMKEDIFECLMSLLQYDYDNEDVLYSVRVCELSNNVDE